MFGHKILNIIPIYENENPERKKASKEELENILEEFKNKVKKPQKQEKDITEKEEPEIPKRHVLKNVRLPKRIP